MRSAPPLTRDLEAVEALAETGGAAEVVKIGSSARPAWMLGLPGLSVPIRNLAFEIDAGVARDVDAAGELAVKFGRFCVGSSLVASSCRAGRR